MIILPDAYNTKILTRFFRQACKIKPARSFITVNETFFDRKI
jgi:hypothetical protein